MTFAPPTSTPQDDGTVKLDPRSQPYVATLTVATGDAEAIVRAPARVAFKDGAVSEVDTPIGGRITDVRVKLGDQVKAGDPLVTVTSPDAAAARAQLSAASAEHDAAAAELARQEHMKAAGVGVESDRLVAAAKLRETDAELARARTTAGLLGGGDGSSVVIRAPIAGTVIARAATVGSVAEPGGSALIELGDPSSVWIIADVFDRDVGGVRAGAAVDVELASQRAPLHGHVVSVGSAATASLRTVPVFVALDAPADVRPGMFARVAIKAPTGQAITLPAEAVLIKDGKDTIVYVKTAADRYTRRTVTVGTSIDGHVEIRDGLKAGEAVVIKGALLLDGSAEQML
ncbi:MAG: efflux RND transporter periplasmic adaptor subunit [Deltaproteobacteria bacterium]|nr:efflux RND transporter periplasmic adaptor subunit [Deltaproteobacteria bacterium]